MARNKFFKRFYQVTKRLREEFPADLPIQFIRKRIDSNHFGYCIKAKKCYKIYIDNRLDESTAIYIGLHESAHAITWNLQNIDHGIEWAKAYGRIYKWYEKNYLLDDKGD